MAKIKVEYICQQCGRRAPKPLGKCPQCGSWNSMVAEMADRHRPSSGTNSQPLRLAEIEGDVGARLPLGIGEFARVLGGGVVPGSVILIGGDPGIGKSTLLLQMSLSLARGSRVLYISGEESQPQIKARAERLMQGRAFPQDLFLLTETRLESIRSHITSMKPAAVVIDSIQTVTSDRIDSGPGSLSQIRESTAQLQSIAKSSAVAIFLVGHVTKDGAIAGPKVLEHIVDTVLYLEGDAFHSFRLLRAVKNRFGATSEVGVFEMQAEGLVEVTNPSEAFLSERVPDSPGSAIAVTMEGTRPLLVELQGLTNTTTFGHPRRTANGIDTNRMLLTIAVLTRRVGLPLADQDIFINVVGGLRVYEPATDLAVAAAIASSMRDQPTRPEMALIGEVGLSGELRRVPHIEARLNEAASLGFRQIIIPRAKVSTSVKHKNVEVIEVASLQQALNRALAKN